MGLGLLTTKTVAYIYRCSGVMGKYAAGELKPPTIGEFNRVVLSFRSYMCIPHLWDLWL